MHSNIKAFVKKAIKVILVVSFWLLVWEAASRIISRNNELLLLILPSPLTVFKKWLEIGFTVPYLTAVASTLLRVFAGFLLGTCLGVILALLTYVSKIAYLLIAPILKIIRTVPVVAIIILLYLFFESNVLPIYIVCLMVAPLIWQTLNDGLNQPNKDLTEMSFIFRFGFWKTLRYIKIPTLLPSFFTATVNALGLAWKSGVAAEVICTPNVSLGTILWQSKGSVNFDEVYAVTITVIVLSLLIETLLKHIYKKHLLKGGIQNDKIN